MNVTPKFLAQAAQAFNRATPEQLGEKLAQVPTNNLVVMRDAARRNPWTLLPQDRELLETVLTAEIARRSEANKRSLGL